MLLIKNYVGLNFFLKIIFILSLLCLLALYILSNQIQINTLIIFPFNFLLFLYFYFRTKSILAIIFLVASVNYIILTIVGWLGLPFSYLQNEHFFNYYDDVAFFDLVFFSILYILVHNISILIKPNNQFALFLFLLGCLLVITNLLFVLPFLGQEYIQTFDKQTSLNEYGWLCLSLWLLFYEGSFYRIKNISIFIVCLLFVFSLLFGARLQLSMFVLAFFVKYFNILKKNKIFIIYLIFVIGGILLGILRDLTTDNLNIEYIFSTINQGASLHASSVYLSAIDENYFTSSQRLMLPIYTFVLSPFLSLDTLPNYISTQSYILNYSNIQGNGGMIGFYVYFYFGILGLVIVPIVFSLLSRFSLTAIAIIVLSFRWQLYNLAPFLKVLVFAIVIYLTYYLFAFVQNRDLLKVSKISEN